MAYSRVTKIGDGVSTQFTVNFALDYINPAYVTARVGSEVDGLGAPVYRAITFLSTNLLQIAGPPAGIGVKVLFERTVPKDGLIVNYSNGDVLDEENLDTSQKQTLMAVQEVIDGRFSTLTQNLDLGGFRVVNSGPPLAPNDLATRDYVDTRVGDLAGIVPDIAAVSTVVDEIELLAPITDEIETVAGIAGAIATVAANSAIITGTASALYMAEDVFVGDGVDTTWTLSTTPNSEANLDVFIGGSIQKTTDFSLVGSTLVITPAVANGVEIIAKTRVQLSANDVEVFAEAAELAAQNAAAVSLQTVETVAIAQATTFPVSAKYLRVAGYATPDGVGAGLAVRRVSEPAHPFKFTSNLGAVWWEFTQPFRPEMIGHFPNDPAFDLSGLIATLSTTSHNSELYLSDGDWYASTLQDGVSLRITGAGSERVRYILMDHPLGEAWRQESRFDSGADLLREEKSTSARSQHTAFTSVSAAGSVANTTYTATVFSLDQDGMGAFQSSLTGALWPRPGRYRLRGAVVWDTSAVGARLVGLAKNGLTSGYIVQQRNADGVTGLATTQEFDFEIAIENQGDYLALLLWQSSGAGLNYTLTASLEAMYQKPIASVGQRVGLCAGPWAGVLTTYGSVEALAQHMAVNYDSYVFCNVLASNSGNGVWPDTPTKTWYNCIGPWANNTVYYAGYRVHDVVTDRMVICLIDHTSPMTGTFADAWAATPSLWRVADQPLDFPYVASAPWLEFGKLVRRVKAIRPEFEVLLYISASLDAPYTNFIGAPWTPYDGSRGFLNVVHFMDRYDRLFPEADGYFYDFFNASCLTTLARDQVVQLAKQRNKKVVCNTVAISAETLRFITECPFIGRGDGVLNEGYEYDAGSSVSAGTDAFLLEMKNHRARGIRSFAFIEETSVVDIVPGSPKRAAAKVKFDANYVPGDCFGHSWASYTTVV